MRLEQLFHLSMRYAEGAWVNPFGTKERAGFGWGDGTVSGDLIRGKVRWANFPRRREDGVWTPNLRGVIRSEDGAEILLSLHGLSVGHRWTGLVDADERVHPTIPRSPRRSRPPPPERFRPAPR